MALINIGMSPVIYKDMPAHRHDVWEIVLNVRGSGITTIGDKSYSFEPGTIICQPPFIPHGKKSDDGFSDIFFAVATFPFAHRNEAIILRDKNENMESLLFMLLRAFHKQDKNCGNLVESLYETIMQLLISWYESEPVDSEVEWIKDMIVQKFTDPEISVSRIMGMSAYNIDHLRRKFKVSTGMSPNEYLTQMRLEYARKLMDEKGLLHYTIADISEMSGYYDSQYFSRIFKRRYGVTPTDYVAKRA